MLSKDIIDEVYLSGVRTGALLGIGLMAFIEVILIVMEKWQ